MKAPSTMAHDPANMTGRVLDFPTQLREALALARSGPDLIGTGRPARVYVVGMGGSAIGGDFVRAYTEARGGAPVEVVRGYELPAACDDSSFAFFVSYSGNTEETLSAWTEAAGRGVPRACVTSGGELAARAEHDGVPFLAIPPGSPPRAALGWTSVPVFHALARAGLAPFEAAELEEAATACETVLGRHGPGAPADDPLRRWAGAAASRLPVVYAASRPYAPVATRWACQINENGKTLAHSALFPEQNHNEIVGWELDSPVLARTEVAFLVDEHTHPRVRRRMDVVEPLLVERGAHVERFEPTGSGLLARLYSFSLMGDLASLYVAAERGVDPTPVASIDHLKSELEKS